MLNVVRRLTTAAALAFLLTGCGETAQSYCHGIYRDGGRTPHWARGVFDDYTSCVSWYEYSRKRLP